MLHKPTKGHTLPLTLLQKLKAQLLDQSSTEMHSEQYLFYVEDINSIVIFTNKNEIRK